MTSSPDARLSRPELDILRLAANGLDNRAIAQRLHLSYWTVKTHLSRVYRKLGAYDRAHAVSLAIRSRQLHPREIQPTDAIREMT